MCLVVLVDCVSCSSSQLWKEFLQLIASSSRRSKGKNLKNVDDRGSVLESLFTWFSSNTVYLKAKVTGHNQIFELFFH